MRTIRDFEYRVSDEFGKGNIPGFLHLYAGQEAVAAGMCMNLTDEDYIVSTHRGHGHAIAKGHDLELMMAELFGKETGYCRGRGGSMHVADQDLGMIGGMGIVAAGLPIAAGAALAFMRQGRDSVALSFFGDGAVHQGAWHEALDFAALLQVPVIFFCENNLYAETTAVDYHLNATSVTAMAVPYGIPAVQVDGMDVFEVRRATEQAIERAFQLSGGALGWELFDEQSVESLAVGAAERAVRMLSARIAPEVGNAGSGSNAAKVEMFTMAPPP